MINGVLFFACILYSFRFNHCHIVGIGNTDLKGVKPPPGSVWPLPQIWRKSDATVTIQPKRFTFTTNDESCIVINNAMRRYKDLIVLNHIECNSRGVNEINRVHIEIESNECGYPQYDDDEYYEIIINSNENVGKINANTVWGALLALETFSQLIYTKKNTRCCYLNVTEIHDFPRFKFRALLIDSSRHYLPKKLILLNLDAMAYNKLNVLHWHIVDDQSWPLKLKKFPELSIKGAYTPRRVYDSNDVSEIIEYARMRGIRVLPEFDTPAHSRIIGEAYYDLLTPCYGEGPNKPDTPNSDFPARAALNPMINESYTFVNDMLSEFKTLFKDNFIHLGFDELRRYIYKCWDSNPNIKKFMNDNGMKHLYEVEQYYDRRVIEIAKNIGYETMAYNDPIINGVSFDNNTILFLWMDKVAFDNPEFERWETYMTSLVKSGYRVVLSACYYLDWILSSWPGMDWEKRYLCDPTNFTGEYPSEIQIILNVYGNRSDHEKSLVIGGEIGFWGEFIDQTNFLSFLWPRGSAVAERLWSNPQQTQNIDDARYRLDIQRCLMLRRGIPAAPIHPGYCGDYEFNMNVPSVGIDNPFGIK